MSLSLSNVMWYDCVLALGTLFQSMECCGYIAIWGLMLQTLLNVMCLLSSAKTGDIKNSYDFIQGSAFEFMVNFMLSGKTECKQSCRDQFVNVTSQWETTWHCNVVSHWLGAYIKLSLKLNVMYSTLHRIYCWLIGKLWYLQHNCVGDIIIYN